MLDNRTFIKIKIKSLAAEARIIRYEEKKNSRLALALQRHRKTIVRSEARHALIAYGFLRNKKYSEIEKSPKEKVDWKKVEGMVLKYGIIINEDESFAAFRKRKEETLEKLKAFKET